MRKGRAITVRQGSVPGASSCGVGLICSIKGAESRSIVSMGIEALKNLTHRGAVGADGKTGDGAGILTQIPRGFFLQELGERGIGISSSDNLAVGVFFFYGKVEETIEAILAQRGVKLLSWREVPTSDDALGESALSKKPVIRQALIDMGSIEPAARELTLYLARRKMELSLGEKVYVTSLSARTIIYKGMLVAQQLERFYPDLADESFISSFCIF
ncbi:MAG: hypothetical protein WC291_01265, partial [Thermodesulfovibrionales bacterium]